jgi:hypothetical protein
VAGIRYTTVNGAPRTEPVLWTSLSLNPISLLNPTLPQSNGADRDWVGMYLNGRSCVASITRSGRPNWSSYIWTSNQPTSAVALRQFLPQIYQPQANYGGTGLRVDAISADDTVLCDSLDHYTVRPPGLVTFRPLNLHNNTLGSATSSSDVFYLTVPFKQTEHSVTLFGVLDLKKGSSTVDYDVTGGSLKLDGGNSLPVGAEVRGTVIVRSQGTLVVSHTSAPVDPANPAVVTITDDLFMSGTLNYEGPAGNVPSFRYRMLRANRIQLKAGTLRISGITMNRGTSQDIMYAANGISMSNFTIPAGYKLGVVNNGTTGRLTRL